MVPAVKTPVGYAGHLLSFFVLSESPFYSQSRGADPCPVTIVPFMKKSPRNAQLFQTMRVYSDIR